MSILPQPPSLLDILLDKVPSKPIKRKMRKVVAVITDAPPSLSFPLSDASPIWSGRVKKIKRGSVVHCDMAGPVLPSHSGIYLSKKKIVSLDSEGEVVVDNPEDFLCGEAEHIYVACNGKESISFPWAAEQTEEKIGDRYDYNVKYNNCHKFVCACVRGKDRGKYKMSGNYAKREVFLLQDVEKELQKIEHIKYDRFNWRVWNR